MAEDKAGKFIRQRDFFIGNLKRQEVQMIGIGAWSKFEIEERINKVQKNARSVESQTQSIVCDPEISEDAKEEAQKVLVDTENLSFMLIDKLKTQLECVQKSDDTQKCDKAENIEPNQNDKRSENQNENDTTNAATDAKRRKQKFLVMKFGGKQSEWKVFEGWLEKLAGNDECDASEKFKIIKQAVSGTLAEFETTA